MARGSVALVASLAILGAGACRRAPEIEGPGPYLQVTIRQNLDGAPGPDRPSELEFRGAATATAESHWTRAGEIECDFPGGQTLRAPCYSWTVVTDISVEPIHPTGLAPREARFAFFSPSKSSPKAKNSAPDTRRFGVSGGLAPGARLPVGSGASLSYLACFSTRRLPLRFRIYEKGELVRHGEIQLAEPGPLR